MERQINQEPGSTYNENNIQNIIINSVDYQRLVDDIKETERDLSEAATDEIRIRKSKRLQDLKLQLNDMKREVSRLYETFTKIPINTERLKQAKEFFEEGKFREADAILKTEEMNNELEAADRLQEEGENKINEAQQVRDKVANEYLIKAQLWTTFYKEPDWYQKANQYYEQALQSSRNVYTLFEYALYLQKHNQFNQAQPLYEDALVLFRNLTEANPAAYLPYVATTLNNLAALHHRKNEFAEALDKYEEALKIYSQLAKANPATYLPDVATTLNNLANLLSDKNEFAEAQDKYEEALKIYSQLAEANPATYMPYVATTLNNLAVLHSDKNEFTVALDKYQEALKIYRKLAEANPATYLPYVAGTLNNLAVMHSDKNEFAEALEKYEEALKIRRKLADDNPAAYLPDVATTLNNLAALHHRKNEFAEAQEKYEGALKIRRKLAKANPATYLPDVSTTLNNLANLLKNKNEFAEALDKYEESLKIYRKLAEANPATYLPYVAGTLNNLSIFYLQNVPDKDKSVCYAVGCILAAWNIRHIPRVEEYIRKSFAVLQANGLNEDDIRRLLEQNAIGNTKDKKKGE